MNTHVRLCVALLVALSAAGCRNTGNANAPGTESATAPPATTAMPAETTMPDASMPAPSSTMAAPGTTTAEPMSGAAQGADQTFLTDASRANEEEIAITALAMEKGGANVKPLATMLNKDHTALRDKLSAASGGMPASPAANAPADLASLTGKDFDTRVLAMLRQDHEKGIALYTTASNNTALSEDVRGLASATLPTLKAHLEQVKSVQAKE